MENSFPDDTLLARWLSNDLTKEEAEAFERHPDRAAYERIARSGGKLRPPAYDAESELTRLLARRKELVKQKVKPQHPPTARQPLRLLRYWSVAAAVLVLLATAWFLWGNGSTSFQARAGELLTADLKDGSTVRLNAGSTLSFKQANQREATLSGEGFFEVAKSKIPFVVTTDYGTVMVLGTSFNVYARDGNLRVACLTGKVRVTFNETDDPYDLLPGEAVQHLAESSPEKSALDREETTDWLNGRSVFNQEPLGEAIRELERQFDLEINLPPGLDLKQKIKTSFGNKDEIDDALKTVLNPLPGVSYQRNGRLVTVRVN